MLSFSYIGKMYFWCKVRNYRPQAEHKSVLLQTQLPVYSLILIRYICTVKYIQEMIQILWERYKHNNTCYNCQGKTLFTGMHDLSRIYLAFSPWKLSYEKIKPFKLFFFINQSVKKYGVEVSLRRNDFSINPNISSGQNKWLSLIIEIYSPKNSVSKLERRSWLKLFKSF